jgi:hypothetical protein
VRSICSKPASAEQSILSSSPYSVASVALTVKAAGTARITPGMPSSAAPVRKQKMISTGCTLAALPSTNGATI